MSPGSLEPLPRGHLSSLVTVTKYFVCGLSFHAGISFFSFLMAFEGFEGKAWVLMSISQSPAFHKHFRSAEKC